ncbi:toxic anion resistance protein [Eremococcus coleocola]|uniref:Toxic anion resistance protein TelA n=1 Tax=Eremococcus coleocola ACS-139-V-Col8 TaxID=908337 RepID=E4KNM8_9LACT|nr:toxic anion resistance protein [Eremococcus coleocola]EFR31453.1 toxic anion resistance protein TelA [Eremococcus coleocola ACS-139-V-Col8]
MNENKEITLDSLMQAKHIELSSGPQTQEETALMINQLEAETEQLSPDKREKIDQIKANINIQDTQLLALYGSNTQKGIAQFSDTILAEVRSKDVGPVGDLMSDLMVKVKDLDIASLDGGHSLMDKIPFLKNMRQSVDRYLAKYDVMQTQIDKIQAQLESSRMALLKDIATYDKLYEKNVDYFQELQLYIVAGEEKVRELKDVTIPKLYSEAQSSNEPMSMQVVKDFEDTVNRFEKRIFDLKTSKTLAIQTAPQIKLIQNNDKLLVDKVTDAVNNVIPLWKSQVVIALGLNRQSQVIQMQKDISNTTNELLERNAKNLRQNTIETAKEAERSIIDIATLKKVNEELITTIEETISIQNNARQARAEAEGELKQIESNLKEALVKAVRG